MLASGCGNAWVDDHGILRNPFMLRDVLGPGRVCTYVNIKWSGKPSFSAQCKCANEGGLAMIASATNGIGSFRTPDALGSFCAPKILDGSVASVSSPFPASKHERQHPRRISRMTLRRFCTSPLRTVSKLGISPGFLTMNAISSAGSPPMQKNSKPKSSINC